MAASFEVLKLEGQKRRAKRAMAAITTIHHPCEIVREYAGRGDWLVVFGWGGSRQQDAMTKHMKSGRNVLVLDIGYFDRERGTIRMSVNCLHPFDQLRLAPDDGSRFDRLKIPLRNDYNPDGHFVVLGLTEKSCRAYGYQDQQWEKGIVKMLRERFGNDRKIVYRPKPKKPALLEGTVDGGTGSIEGWLRGAAGCFVHHSNVALDCAIAGVPCFAVDGIGKGFWPANMGEVISVPSIEQRHKYLRQAAWFNWRSDEIGEMIRFAIEVARK